LALVVWAHQAFGSLQTVPVIRTTSGKLKGISVSSSTNAYLGIPYAIPPLGTLRFQAPRELITPLLSRNATSFGPACIQLPSSNFSPSPTGESEDCLSLNVWASKNNTAALPKRAYNFTNWADAHPEIVFVSVNYRLNLFGYPQTPAINRPETNAGLRDQRLAIEWVFKNIAAFGGDPTRVILGVSQRALEVLEDIFIPTRTTLSSMGLY
ncbi:10003_t:CDS:2, partial [Acaulospora colombiana]